MHLIIRYTCHQLYEHVRISFVDRLGTSQALGVSHCLVKPYVPVQGETEDRSQDKHTQGNCFCLLCSQFGLGLHDGSLTLLKLSLLFEAGTAGLTEKPVSLRL